MGIVLTEADLVLGKQSSERLELAKEMLDFCVAEGKGFLVNGQKLHLAQVYYDRGEYRLSNGLI